jgi:hypothetical protein
MAAASGARSRRFWIDPRFLVGVLLVAASVTGVGLLLAVQNRSVQVYVARSTLVPGEPIGDGDLQLTSVRVPGVGVYVTRANLPRDPIAMRSVPKGELVPASAIGAAAESGFTTVVVKVSGPLSASVASGATVDVWAAQPATAKAYRPPAVLVSSASVVAVVHDDALVADRSAVSVEMRVPQSRVAAVLQSAADGQVLSVVPTGVGAAKVQPLDTDGTGSADDTGAAHTDAASTPTPGATTPPTVPAGGTTGGAG